MVKVVADHLVKSSGIRPLLHTFAVDVIMDEGKIRWRELSDLHQTTNHLHILFCRGVVTESKSGRRAIIADRSRERTKQMRIQCKYKMTLQN